MNFVQNYLGAVNKLNLEFAPMNEYIDSFSSLNSQV